MFFPHLRVFLDLLIVVKIMLKLHFFTRKLKTKINKKWIINKKIFFTIMGIIFFYKRKNTVLFSFIISL